MSCLQRAVFHFTYTSHTSFEVVPQEVQPILDLLTCDKLKTVKRVLSIEAEDSSYQELLEEYKNVFPG